MVHRICDLEKPRRGHILCNWKLGFHEDEWPLLCLKREHLPPRPRPCLHGREPTSWVSIVPPVITMTTFLLTKLRGVGEKKKKLCQLFRQQRKVAYPSCIPDILLHKAHTLHSLGPELHLYRKSEKHYSFSLSGDTFIDMKICWCVAYFLPFPFSQRQQILILLAVSFSFYLQISKQHDYDATRWRYSCALPVVVKTSLVSPHSSKHRHTSILPNDKLCYSNAYIQYLCCHDYTIIFIFWWHWGSYTPFCFLLCSYLASLFSQYLSLTHPQLYHR